LITGLIINNRFTAPTEYHPTPPGRSDPQNDLLFAYLQASAERNIRLADRIDGFSLELILPVHSPDLIPKCHTANIEIIIAQFAAICTGNFDFSRPAAWMQSSRPAACKPGKNACRKCGTPRSGSPQHPVHIILALLQDALLGVRLQELMLDIRSHQNRAKLQFFYPIRSFV
jgi:hypothetical protein